MNKTLRNIPSHSNQHDEQFQKNLKMDPVSPQKVELVTITNQKPNQCIRDKHDHGHNNQVCIGMHC